MMICVQPLDNLNIIIITLTCIKNSRKGENKTPKRP